MSHSRSSLALLAALGILVGASTAAHATPVSVGPTSYNDVGLGNLSGYNPFNVIDDQTAILTVKLTETAPGLVTTDLVAETLDGHSFTLTQHGSVTGSGDSYLAGFTFNLPLASFIEYVPSSAGQSWTWTKGFPTVSGGTVTPGAQIGSDDASYFASLGGGTLTKFTLLFSGAVDLAVGQTESFSGTLSAVPLPGSLVMFGSALVGLTMLGARRRRPVVA